MKRSKISCLGLILVAAASLSCASTNEPGSGSRGRSVLDVASMLSGSWKAEGSDLRLEISSIAQDATTREPYQLFASATGQVGGRTVNERAVISLEWDGDDTQVSVVPRFNPAVTQLSDVSEVSPDELRAACTFDLDPTQTGYSGETQGGEACVRAVQGAVGEWHIEVTPETLQLASAGNQQLLFRRVGR